MPVRIIEKYDRQFEYAGILMNTFIVYQFLQLWFFPQLNQAEKIYSMSSLMAFEFVLVHSGVFMALMPKKWSLIVFVPFYGLFAYAFNKSMPNNVILITYMFVILNRMRFAFFNVDKKLKDRTILFSIIALIAYFVLLFIVAFSSKILPPFGLTNEFLNTSGYNELKNSSGGSGGLFLDAPQTGLLMGVLYYSVLTIIEAKLISYKK
ncbi:hypothetical protein [Galbibacter sp. PAP.153]|uniref:hypothetical protein n=1 Tax=Galbibacter sp. PAP.153 TaxID=3104623 RepID=UPI0030093644